MWHRKSWMGSRGFTIMKDTIMTYTYMYYANFINLIF